jgi:catechol 2,3-dioxygenase-like lactoylglutathione lyase family enzyme
MTGPMKLSPSSVAVLVSDKKKAVQWYTKKLGLDLIDDGDHWAVVGDKKRGIGLHLCQMTGARGKPKLEKGNTGILILTDGELLPTYRAMKRRGIRFPHPPTKTEWGWFCMFADPDGNEFWLNPNE